MWPITWGNDGNLYSIWGDGGGFGGTNTSGRVSTGIAQIGGTPPSLVATNVNGGVNSEVSPSWACTSCGKSDAIISVGGVLYAWFNTQTGGSSPIHKLMWSNDLGKTWQYSSWQYPDSAYPAVMPGSFINFGQDYAGAPDNYVYMYFQYLATPFANDTYSLWLTRVPKDQLTNESAYQIFTGLDANGNPTWSTSIVNAKPVFTDPNGVGWQQSVYDPYLHRYLLTVVHGENSSNGYNGNGTWGMFDAPNPWGPWTTVTYVNQWQDSYPKFSFSIPQKWMSTDGKNFVMVYSGTGPYDSWNTINGTFNTTNTTPTPQPSTPAPTLSLSASPTTVSSGGSTTLTW
ncbi:MAG: hypothetical protein B7X04_04145, partial [Parcubacteria group bacterium 21-54-25]